MIQLRNQYSLLLCSLNIEINDNTIYLRNVLIDTGSATTLINSNYISLDGTESIRKAYGVGGYETILKKKVLSLKINDLSLYNFDISVGTMDYGINLDCILGLDILKLLNAKINITDMTLFLTK